MSMPFRFVTVLSLFLSFAMPFFASADEYVPRRVLALYQPLVEPLRIHELHKMAEMPLNHLGYTVEYHAERHYRDAVALRPACPDMLTALAETLERSDRSAEAVEVRERLDAVLSR